MGSVWVSVAFDEIVVEISDAHMGAAVRRAARERSAMGQFVGGVVVGDGVGGGAVIVPGGVAG